MGKRKQLITFEAFLRSSTHQKESHWKKNTIRYLIPFELLDAIFCQYLERPKSTTIVVDSVRYVYSIDKVDDPTVLKLQIHIHEKFDDKSLYDKKRITLFNDYVIVLRHMSTDEYEFVTAYPLGFDFEYEKYEEIKQNLLSQKFDQISSYKSDLFNNFLAILLIEDICNKSSVSKFQKPHLTFDNFTKEIQLSGKNYRLLYKFNREEAVNVVNNLKLPDVPYFKDVKYTVVYFVNFNFEQSGNRKVKTNIAEAISIKEFFSRQKIEAREWINYEIASLYLVYNSNGEQLDWINNKYALPFLVSRINENKIGTIGDNSPISNSLFQDALNTLSLVWGLKTSLDYFHFLCASNLVNAKYNEILHNCRDKNQNDYYIINNKIVSFKYHIINIVETWIQKRVPYIRISFGHVKSPGETHPTTNEFTLLINISVEGADYQFRYRMKSNQPPQRKRWVDFMEFAKKYNVSFEGVDSCIYLQRIAPELFQYSYLLKLGYSSI